jgi:hypothetical protein
VGGASLSDEEDFGNVTQFGIAVLGKYPIELGTITLFPLLGISYNMVLSAKDPDGNKYDDAGDLSQLGILAGIGLDVNITDALFFRAEGIFQLRLPNKMQKDMADYMKAYYGVDFPPTVGLGPVIKVAIGYRL